MIFAVLIQVESEPGVPQLLLDCFANGSADVGALVLLGMNAVDQLVVLERHVVVRHLQIFELEEEVSGCGSKPAAASHQPSDVVFDCFAVAEDITS